MTLLSTQQPYVLIDLADEDPSRGDCHAYRNLGRLFAEKTGRECIFTNDNSECQAILDANGLPDVVFSFKNRDAYKGLYQIQENNENLSYYANYVADECLVSHHITAESLLREKKSFEDAYQGLKGRRIALMNISTDENDRKIIADGLLRMVSSSPAPQTTIFICGMRRTDFGDHQNLVNDLRQIFENNGLSDSVDLKSYAMSKDFNERALSHNPYLGLIATADHFLIAGHSMSIVSECLMSGKTLMLINNTAHTKLADDGICHYFKTLDFDRGFPTQDIKPVNITEAVVDGLIKHFLIFEQNKAAKSGPKDSPFLSPL